MKPTAWGFHHGRSVVLGPAPCQGCRALVWWQQDKNGRGWRSEDEYGSLVPHRCVAKRSAA